MKIRTVHDAVVCLDTHIKKFNTPMVVLTRQEAEKILSVLKDCDTYLEDEPEDPLQSWDAYNKLAERLRG